MFCLCLCLCICRCRCPSPLIPSHLVAPFFWAQNVSFNFVGVCFLLPLLLYLLAFCGRYSWINQYWWKENSSCCYCCFFFFEKKSSHSRLAHKRWMEELIAPQPNKQIAKIQNEKLFPHYRNEWSEWSWDIENPNVSMYLNGVWQTVRLCR